MITRVSMVTGVSGKQLQTHTTEGLLGNRGAGSRCVECQHRRTHTVCVQIYSVVCIPASFTDVSLLWLLAGKGREFCEHLFHASFCHVTCTPCTCNEGISPIVSDQSNCGYHEYEFKRLAWSCAIQRVRSEVVVIKARTDINRKPFRKDLYLLCDVCWHYTDYHRYDCKWICPRGSRIVKKRAEASYQREEFIFTAPRASSDSVRGGS